VIYNINQNKLTDEIKKKIFQGFGCQAIQAIGIDGLSEDPISFEISNDTEFVGAIVVQPFWGQLHIKYLFVEEKLPRSRNSQTVDESCLGIWEKTGMPVCFCRNDELSSARILSKNGFRD
jgi:hypothetical protein